MGNAVVKYRPDIDGLRAVAVLAVVLFHAFPSVVRGGFVGVDVFFVISGYLISGIIFSTLAQGTFSFRDFYARRIRRIFPALLVVVVAAYAAGWWLLFSAPFAQLGKHIATGVGFVANYALWQEAGYFDGASDTKPLLHLWSLGVEEQFYLLWPLVAWLAWKRRLDLFTVAFAILVVSLSLNLERIRRDLVATFYAPETRVWELMAGVLLAHAVTLQSQWRPVERIHQLGARLMQTPRARNAWSIVGAILIAGSILGIDQARHYPGRWALLPVGGAALLIAVGPDAWVNRNILGKRLLVALGLISYPLYLWHWPILTFLRLLQGEVPPAWVRALALVSSFVLAWLTYAIVERPIRFGPRRTWIVIALCLAMAAIGSTGYYTYRADGIWSRAINRSDRASFSAYYDAMKRKGIARPYRLECDFMELVTDRAKDHIAPECTAAGAEHTWFLWGDSHAQALSPGLTAVLPASTRLAQVATSSCPPTFEPVDANILGGRCARANAFAIERIAALKPDVLIVAQMGGHLATDWNAFAAEAHRRGAKRVVLVGPLPMWLPSLPELVVGRFWESNHDRIGYGLVPERPIEDERLRQRYQDSPALTYVSLISQLCNRDGCLATVPGADSIELMSFDVAHLTPLGSRYVAEHILRPALVGQ
jgi:peptidoglycan/LPS O-acetylase OafA/YrhL